MPTDPRDLPRYPLTPQAYREHYAHRPWRYAWIPLGTDPSSWGDTFGTVPYHVIADNYARFANGSAEYVVILGDDVHFVDGRLLGSPSVAEVRFFLMDYKDPQRLPAQPLDWYMVAGPSSAGNAPAFVGWG